MNRHHARIRLFIVFLAMLTLISQTAFGSFQREAVSLSEEYHTPLDDSFIDQETAYYIALLFLQNYSAIDDLTTWTSETGISNSVIMYDNTRTNTPSAYSFELSLNGKDNGYIIISAYADVPNIVLEFSDTSRPLYDSFDLSPTDQLIYLGGYNYFKDTGTTELLGINHCVVNRNSLYDSLANIRSKENIQDNHSSMSNPASILQPHDAVITDPIAHANQYLQGPFVSSGDYYDYWQRNNYITYYNMSGFSGYTNHCGPTAITHIARWMGSRYSISSIKNLGKDALFDKVVIYGIMNSYYVNGDPLGGTLNLTAGRYIRGCFDEKFNVTVDVSGLTDITFDNVKAAFHDNKLLYLALDDNNIYGDHAVAGFGYTRLVSQTTGYYKSYIKVADGWSSAGGRYIDGTILMQPGSRMYMVKYISS